MSKLVHNIDYKKLSETIRWCVRFKRIGLSQNYFMKLFKNDLTKNEIMKLFKCLKDLGFIIPYGKTKYHMWSKKRSCKSSYFTEDVVKQIFEENNIQSKLGTGKVGRKKGQKYEYKVSNKSNLELLDMICRCQLELENRSKITQIYEDINNLSNKLSCSIDDLPVYIKKFVKSNNKYEI